MELDEGLGLGVGLYIHLGGRVGWDRSWLILSNEMLNVMPADMGMCPWRKVLKSISRFPLLRN